MSEVRVHLCKGCLVNAKIAQEQHACPIVDQCVVYEWTASEMTIPKYAARLHVRHKWTHQQAKGDVVSLLARLPEVNRPGFRGGRLV
jgi:hypothetical protein